jgi:uncharacterized protein YeaO (DUF488 family)
MDIRIKRAYEPPSPADGTRILVDRLWPRGVKKEALALASWHKDVAPSTALRQWFGHRADRFAEFAARYRKELDADPAAAAFLHGLPARGRVTLVYAARDPQVNHAAVLRDWLRARAG